MSAPQHLLIAQTARRNRKAKIWGSPSARTKDERHKDLYTAGKVVNAGSVGGRQVSHSSSLFARRSTWRARVVWESLGTLISDTRLNDLVRPTLVGAVPAVVASAWWCTLPQRLLLVVQLLPLFPLSLPPFLSLFLLARSCLHLQSARRRCRDVRRVLTHMRQVWLGQDRGIPTTPGSTERGRDEQQPRRTRSGRIRAQALRPLAGRRAEKFAAKAAAAAAAAAAAMGEAVAMAAVLGTAL